MVVCVYVCVRVYVLFILHWCCNCSIIFTGFCWPPQGVRFWYLNLDRDKVLWISIYNCKTEKKVYILMQNIYSSLVREHNLYMSILRTAAVDSLTSAVATSYLLWYQVIQQTFTEPQVWVTHRGDKELASTVSLSKECLSSWLAFPKELIGINW